jgi:prepilin-type N-terminal cleavage/methylation domain-containing protein
MPSINIKNKLKKKGFTLVELLVVISIIGILTIITLASFTNAQKKGRDTRRKAELDALSKAMMMYFNDTGSFPASIGFENASAGLTGPGGDYYIRTVPTDPKNTPSSTPPFNYVYVVSATRRSFSLFANLENTSDPKCEASPYVVSAKNYCYGISSPNTLPSASPSP